jgi:hypothetical protein
MADDTGLRPFTVSIPRADLDDRVLRVPGRAPRRTRSHAERLYTDLRYWDEPDRGGRFAAWEQPVLFVDELRRCFRDATDDGSALPARTAQT